MELVGSGLITRHSLPKNDGFLSFFNAEPIAFAVTLFLYFSLLVILYCLALWIWHFCYCDIEVIVYLGSNPSYAALYMDELEEECGQIEDLVMYFIYFIIFCFWYYMFVIIFGDLILKSLGWILFIFITLVTLGSVLPTSTLLKFGAPFVHYIRGSVKTTNFLFEALLDFIGVFVIMMRFFVQNIRFVFMFVAFFEYYEFIMKIDHLYVNNFSPRLNYQDWVSNKYYMWKLDKFIIAVCADTGLYLYYLGHSTITYIAQLAIYVILSFWIFFFLYATFFMPQKEKLFLFRKVCKIN